MKPKSKIQYPKIRICNNCNCLFVENAFTVFCSVRCKNEFIRKQKYKKAPNHKQAKIFKILPINEVFKTVPKTCTVCSKDISDKRKNTKYCSKKCKATARKELKEHEKNLM